MRRAYLSVNENWYSYNKSLHARTSTLELSPWLLYLLFSFRVTADLLNQCGLAPWAAVCALLPWPDFMQIQTSVFWEKKKEKNLDREILACSVRGLPFLYPPLLPAPPCMKASSYIIWISTWPMWKKSKLKQHASLVGWRFRDIVLRRNYMHCNSIH